MKFQRNILFFAITATAALAMDGGGNQKYEGNTTSSGELISIETLAKLAKEHKAPKNVRKSLAAWFKTSADGYKDAAGKGGLTYKDLIATLARPLVPLSAYKEQAAVNRAIIEYFTGRNIPAYRSPSYNYVIEPVPGYALCITGVGNRLNAVIASNPRPDGTWRDPYSPDMLAHIDKTPEKLDELAPVATQHVISIFANYLLLSKFARQYHAARVVVPHTYLVHIPDQPTAIEDSNYVVLQEKVVEGLTDLSEQPAAWAQVSDAALSDLFNVNKVGFWQEAYKLQINREGNFVLPAPEQPNNSDIHGFFNKIMNDNSAIWGDIRGSRAWARYIVMGLENINKTLKTPYDEITQMVDAARQLIMNGKLAECAASIETSADRWRTLISNAQFLALLKNTLYENKNKAAALELINQVKNASLSSLLLQKLTLWKNLIKAHPNWVESYSKPQQEKMNSLAAD